MSARSRVWILSLALVLGVANHLDAGACEIVLGVWDPKAGQHQDRVVVGRVTIEGRS